MKCAETGFIHEARFEKYLKTSTLFSFCFYYPDGSGGNLTTDNSASSMVDEGFIEKCNLIYKVIGTEGIIMAAPEVPLAARKKLIELGKQYGLFCSASFTTGEISEVLNSEIIAKIDLIAINIDEALAVAGLSSMKENAISIVKHGNSEPEERNRKFMISVTAGKDGSWCWDGTHSELVPGNKGQCSKHSRGRRCIFRRDYIRSRTRASYF